MHTLWCLENNLLLNISQKKETDNKIYETGGEDKRPRLHQCSWIEQKASGPLGMSVNEPVKDITHILLTLDF